MKMARKPIVKELVNTNIANTYGGWLYCAKCNETIGYLCYVTYDNFHLTYTCRCGSQGAVHIAFQDVIHPQLATHKLIRIKNRLCCPKEKTALFTLLDKKLRAYEYEIDCIRSQTRYKENKENE